MYNAAQEIFIAANVPQQNDEEKKNSTIKKPVEDNSQLTKVFLI